MTGPHLLLADFIKFLFFVGEAGSSDSIISTGISDSAVDLGNWIDDGDKEYEIVGTNAATSAIVIAVPSEVSEAFANGNEEYATRGAKIKIVRENYFIADGNVYVSD